MHKLKKIMTLLFIVPAMTYGQQLSKDFTVTTGAPYDVIDAGSKEYVSLDNGYVLMAKMGSGIVNLQKYDVNGMKEVARNTYEDLPKGAFFLDILKLGNKVFYLYEAEEAKTKNYIVYAREIDTENAKFKTQVELFKTSREPVNPRISLELTRTSVVLGPLARVGKFLIYKSFDESKVLISYRMMPVSKSDVKNYDDLGFYVFDGSMQKIWGKEVKMPYTEEDMNNIAYGVSNSGDVKMLVTNNATKSYELFTISANSDLKIKDLKISTDQLVRNLKMREDDKGNFVCAGFYANGIEVKVNINGPSMIFNANGLMYFKFDSEGNVLTKENFDFTSEFIKQNLNERLKKDVEDREKEGKAGIFDLFLIDFVVKEDGSSYFIGEQQYIRNELYGPQQQTVYHFSNIVVIKVDPSGKLAWMKKLAKNQAGVSGSGQMSYSLLQGKTSDYVAFVDNPKNIDLDANGGIPEAHKDGMGGFLTTYKFNHADGTLQKHTICDLENIGGVTAYQFKAWRIFKASEGVFLMEIYIKGKQDTMVKFKVN